MLEDSHGQDYTKMELNKKIPISRAAATFSIQSNEQRFSAKATDVQNRPVRSARDFGARRRGNGGSAQHFTSSRQARNQCGKRQPIKHPDTPDHPNPFSPSMIEDDEIEVGSIFNPGSKKQSLNHLLNFHYEPRGFKERYLPRRSKDFVFQRAKFNKDQYLQANCHFVVKDGANYDKHLVDPDTLVDWCLVEEVILKTSASVPSCPICLYPPVAAKITKCGHVYCWACLLHYLALSDDSWRKCPICFGPIYKQDLKSVVSVAWKVFSVGDEVEMRLMRRERNSLFALPVDAYSPAINFKHPNMHDFAKEGASYSQLIRATPEDVDRHIISREREELELQFSSSKDQPEACFLEEALQSLNERQASLNNPGLSSSVAAACAARPEKRFSLAKNDQLNSLSDGEDCSLLDLMKDIDISGVEPDLASNEAESSSCLKPKSTFYFYQSSDGQPIFLHALNVQMLVKQYGALELCPSVIRGSILEKDNSSITETLRNKLRYLKHLPISSYFEICELKLSNPKIEPSILEEFADELESRNQIRRRRAREEKRREKKLSIELNKTIMGKFPEPKFKIESEFHFPQVGAPVENTSQDATVSFAKMLRNGVARPVNGLAKSQQVTCESDVEHEGCVPPPHETNIGDLLEEALKKSAASEAFVVGSARKKGKKLKGTNIYLTAGGRI